MNQDDSAGDTLLGLSDGCPAARSLPGNENESSIK
jgi:hypothetical protein